MKRIGLFFVALPLTALFSSYHTTRHWKVLTKDLRFGIERSTPSKSTHSPRDEIGHWIGNTWIPPSHWKYYGLKDLQKLYRDKNVVWIGDSTGRRGSMTFYAMLNNSNDHSSVQSLDHKDVIDINRFNNQQEICQRGVNTTAYAFGPNVCRPMPAGAKGRFDFIWANELEQIDQIAKIELQNNVTGGHLADENVIFIVMGVVDAILGDANRNTNRTINETVASILTTWHDYAQRSNKRVVWRTTGYSYFSRIHNINAVNERIRTMNEQVRETIDSFGPTSRFTYIDWSRAIEPRAFGDERIRGDIAHHFGLELRIVLTQMFTNHLHDRGFFHDEDQ